MKISTSLSFVLATVTAMVGAPREASAEPAPPLTAAQIVAKVTESSSWGLGGAEIKAKAVVTDKAGKARALVFDAKSRQYAASLGKSVITFQAPADVAGMKFLQIQNASSDDERFLYLPELKRVRRVAGSNRSDSFMGTDFSYADIDQRESGVTCVMVTHDAELAARVDEVVRLRDGRVVSGRTLVRSGVVPVVSHRRERERESALPSLVAGSRC